MSSENPTLPSAGGPDDQAGFPEVGSSLFERLEVLRGDDPEIDLAPEEGGGVVGRAPGTGKLRYVRSGELGRGGMGVVYKVYDSELRRNLAMKVLRLGTAGSSESPTAVEPQIVRRFLEEAQVTGQLDHPSIVPLHELGLDEDGRIYFTMRVVRGKDLEAIVRDRREGRSEWTLSQLVAALLKVCDAMSFAHAKGVIHRDLKPANIMAGKFGEVYVMDWGLAKVLGRQDERDLRPDLGASQAFTAIQTERDDSDEGFVTMEGTVCGTPAFMSPEQALGLIEELDARSDIYSLGAVLYHILTGYPPYVPGGARIAGHVILKWVTEGPPKQVREVEPSAPVELAAICDKAMARSPEDRYQTVAELRSDLGRYLRGKPVHALHLGVVHRAVRWCRRNPVALGLVAAVIFAAGAGLWIMNSLTTAIVQETVRESAVLQARVLEEVNGLYTSEVVAPLRGTIEATHDYKARDATIPAPATFLTTLTEQITGSDAGVMVRHYSDYPFAFRSDGGPRDEFERTALARLREDAAEPIFSFETIDGRPFVRYATPRVLKQGCVDCHNAHPESTKTDWEVGEVRGVLAIQQPLGEEFARTQERLRGTFILVGLIALGLAGIVALGVIRMRRGVPETGS